MEFFKVQSLVFNFASNTTKKGIIKISVKTQFFISYERQVPQVVPSLKFRLILLNNVFHIVAYRKFTAYYKHDY